MSDERAVPFARRLTLRRLERAYGSAHIRQHYALLAAAPVRVTS